MRCVAHGGLETLTEIGGGLSTAGSALAVEVVELSALRRRAGAAALAAAHRAEAHAVILVTRGRGWHGLDFTAHPCSAGTLVRVRPEQVQQFQVPSRLGGIQVRFTADVPAQTGSGTLERLLHARDAPVSSRLTSVEQAEIGGIVDSLAAEYEQGGAAHRPEILAHLLLALLLRVDRLTESADGAAVAPTAEAELFARFEDELERSFATTRRAADYAALLGSSVRTLTRACQGSVGRPVRDVIDARVVLEAKRLLATSDEPLAELGHRLGFSEAAGLGRFFTRHVGTSPGVFRRRYRGDGGGGRRSQRAG